MSDSRKVNKCPICSAPTDVAYRPFCSRRCADVDLGRWLSGGYVIAGANDDQDPEYRPDDDDEKQSD